MTQPLLVEEKVENQEIDNLLIQVHKSKFREYIARGLVCPDKVLGEEIESDTQSKFKDFLLLSTGYLDELDEEQLLLEIILTNNEKENLKEINSNVYLLDKPLPITRVKTIYVSNKKIDSVDMQKSLKNYNMGYISEKLFVTFPKGKKKFIQYFTEASNEHKADEYNEKVLNYDKLMGLFASIKNTNLYYINENNIYQNYSDNYFSIFYNYDEKTIKVSKWIEDKFYSSNIDKLFIKRLNSINYINEEFLTRVIEIVKEDEIKNKLEMLRDDPLGKKRILASLKNYKEPIYYYISLLFIYGKKGSNSKYAFKDNIIEEISYEKAENALALFGLYYGYSSLPAYEEIHIEDKEFQKITKGNEFNIKFKLDSKLDYYLIESLYQYVFNSKKEGIQIDYLDEILGTIKAETVKLPINQNFKRWYNIENKKKILDIENIKIKKLNWGEIIDNKMDKYPDIISFPKYYLTNFIGRFYKNLLSDRKDDGSLVETYANREDFIQTIKIENNKNRQNELFKIFEIDKK